MTNRNMPRAYKSHLPMQETENFTEGSKAPRIKKRLLNVIDNFEFLVSAFALIALVVLLTISIYARYFSGFSIPWSEEVARFMFIAVIFSSISYTARQHRHIRVTLFVEKLFSKKAQNIVFIIGDIVWLVFNAVILYGAYIILSELFEYPYNSPVLNLPMYYVYAIIPIFFFTISVRVIQGIIKRLRGTYNYNHTPEA